MLFVLKKILAQFVMPEQFCILMMFIGLIFLWFTKYIKAAKILLTTAILLLALFSCKFFVNIISSPLENKYPPISANNSHNKEIKFIVVLGGGTKYEKSKPLTSSIGETTLTRLSEGVRLLKLCPNAKLILSGGKAFSEKSEAAVMKELLQSVGISTENVVCDSISLDTEQQALYLKHLVKENKFYLVTSAIHMPRSMSLFKGNGMNPIAAPTDYTIPINLKSPYYYFPSAYFLKESTQAIHEYVGSAWLYIKRTAFSIIK